MSSPRSSGVRAYIDPDKLTYIVSDNGKVGERQGPFSGLATLTRDIQQNYPSAGLRPLRDLEPF